MLRKRKSQSKLSLQTFLSNFPLKFPKSLFPNFSLIIVYLSKSLNLCPRGMHFISHHPQLSFTHILIQTTPLLPFQVLQVTFFILSICFFLVFIFSLLIISCCVVGRSRLCFYFYFSLQNTYKYVIEYSSIVNCILLIEAVFKWDRCFVMLFIFLS